MTNLRNLYFLLCVTSFQLMAQNAEINEDAYTSIRHEQTVFYNTFEGDSDVEENADSINFNILGEQLATNFYSKTRRPSTCQLKKVVYGYHPSWLGSKHYNNYDYSLLTTFSYFGYQLNPVTGGYKSIGYWKTTNSIYLAKKAGCKVELCVSNFGAKNNSRFLNNRKAWNRLISTLIELLDYRDAHGVNIDFEGVPKSQSRNLTNFMIHLSNRLKRERPGSTVTMAVPANNPGNIYNIAKMQRFVDLFVIMGYDYHYSKSKQAGPVAPLDGWLSLKKTVNDYLKTGTDRQKLVLAVPYYGREWRTRSSRVPSSTTAYVKAPTYAQVRNSYTGKFTEKWDNKSATPYFVQRKGKVIKQCWYDNEKSLSEKYDLALLKDIGGVGVWALGYDNGYNELWDLLEDKFMDCNMSSRNDGMYRNTPFDWNKVYEYFKTMGQ